MFDSHRQPNHRIADSGIEYIWWCHCAVSNQQDIVLSFQFRQHFYTGDFKLQIGNIIDRKFLVAEKYNRALINTFVENDSVYFLTKNSGKKMAMTLPAKVCTRTDAHSSLSCSSFHTSWAPTCIGCHNSFDENEPGYNMIKNKEQKGSWVEHIGTYESKLPTLGIHKTENKMEIILVSPEMILTINKKSFTGNENDAEIFHRLYAPVAPHTTSKQGRSCVSCHNNPNTLGYGEGKLIYKTDNGTVKWYFESLYENDSHDNLPLNAWIGFLQNRNGAVSTRSDVFPFSVEKQKEILTVGACLTCHDEKSKVMNESLNNFEELLKNLSNKCILPVW